MKANRLVQSLTEFCRDHLLDEKWLVAPSLRAGRQWLDAATRSGAPLVNIRVSTLRGMALELAAPALAGTKRRLVSGRGSAILVDGILNRLKEQSPMYLTNLRLTPSLALSVSHTITDLRLAGLDQDSLRPVSFEPPDKGREMIAIVHEYLETLSRMDLVDYAGALDLTTRVSRTTLHSGLADVWVLIPEDLEQTAKEREFVGAFPQNRVVPLGVDEPDTLPPDAMSALSDAALLRWIREPSKAPGLRTKDGSVELFRAVGEPNEVREVFRRCIEKGWPLDEVELLHTDTATYGPLIYELAARLQPDFSGPGGLFVTFEEGIPATYSRPGRGLSAWVEWITGGHLQSTLVTMLQEVIVRTPASADGHFSQGELARLLRAIAIGFGRDRYLPRVEDKVREFETPAFATKRAREEEGPVADASHDRQCESVAAARCLLEFLHVLLDTSPDSHAPIEDVLLAALRFLDNVSRKADELDNYAYRALRKEVEDLLGYVGGHDGLLSLDVWEWLRLLPGEVRVMGSGPRPGCLHVSSIFSGGHSMRSHTFIVGLDEARFPGSGIQDPILLDSERRNLSDKLPTAAGRLGKKLDNFTRLIARLRGTVTLSYSCRDLTDDREIFPCQVMLNAHRIISENRKADFRDLDSSLGTPASFGPPIAEKCLDTTEWWLSLACVGAGVMDPERVLARHFAHLARGKQAQRSRQSPEFTVYDGLILEQGRGRELDPSSDSGLIMSPSRLEAIGKCPRAYFFQYVLRLKPLEDLTIDPDQWLNPMEFGGLVHEIFHAFVSRMGLKGWPPAYPDDLKQLLDIVEARAEQYRHNIPALSEEAYLSQVNRLRQAAEIFLRVEAESVGTAPVYLEAALGMEQSFPPGTAIDTEEPLTVSISDGREIRVRGRLDRIDRIGDPASDQYAVCDYKSGSAWKYETADPFNGGRVVQHALYVAMANARLKEAVAKGAAVDRFVYFFPGQRDHGLRMGFSSAALSEWPTVVAALCDISASGSFLSSDDPDTDCTFCDYRTVCRDVQGVAAASKVKLENIANTLLKPMRELRRRVQ